MLKLILPDELSTFIILTSTMSPIFKQSSTLFTLSFLISEICTRPSLLGVILTNAPKSNILTPSPFNTSPTLGF